MALSDKVPGNDVKRTDPGARSLLFDPAEQSRVRGHDQVLQRLCGVSADVFQVLCQVDPSDKEAAWNTFIHNYDLWLIQSRCNIKTQTLNPAKDCLAS